MPLACSRPCERNRINQPASLFTAGGYLLFAPSFPFSVLPYNNLVTKQADLLVYLFSGQPHLLSPTLLGWMETSSRFTAFIETYRDKVRKKIRTAPDPESALDLLGELEIAYCLLSDRRLAVTYEPYASAKRRGPDFAVTYRTNLVFNLEVARLRAEEGPPDLPRVQERILRILLDKLGQMQPGMPNLLTIHSQAELTRTLDLSSFMQALKLRVEARDPSFYAAGRSSGRYSSPADFYKDFLRLSGILLWAPGAQLWVNKQARPLLEEKVLHLVAALPG
jgi:hypothetical protein